MKTLKSDFIVLLLIFFTCTSFYVVNREEEIHALNNKTAFVADKCFQNFMKSMNELGAVFYIPDTKLEKGKELGLQPKEKSAGWAEEYDFNTYFDQVTPIALSNDECSQKVKLTLADLQMLIFVEKKKSDQYSNSGVQKMEFKLTGLKYKLEGKFTLTEKLNFKLTNNTTVSMVPVEWNM